MGATLFEIVIDCLAHLAVGWRATSWLALIFALLAVVALVAGFFTTAALCGICVAVLLAVGHFWD